MSVRKSQIATNKTKHIPELCLLRWLRRELTLAYGGAGATTATLPYYIKDSIFNAK